MTELPVRYLVTCACTGEDQEIAFIDDNRPDGGVIISSPYRGPDDEVRGQTVIVADVSGDHLGLAPDELMPGVVRDAERALSETNVTETVWADWHSSWAIRCTDCQQQAQMSSDTLDAVADALLRAIDSLESRQTIDPDSERTVNMRRVIPLGVLHRIVLHVNG